MVSQAPKVPVCATCNQEGHAKSNSSLCTKKNPLWSSTLPGCGPNEQVKAEYSIIKCTLDAIIKNDTLHDKIEETVRAMTQVQYEASRLLELHLRRCLDEGITLPTVSSSEPAFVRKCFNMARPKKTGTSSIPMSCIEVHGANRVSCLLCPSQRVLAHRFLVWLSRPMQSTVRPTFSIDTGPFYADTAIWSWLLPRV
ncbi:uncharacterized protein BJ171DRAFT_515720 [Polychytrium aggregatum]|uniref:uncharacterized protein n=1 Tax=Polychytrium aggregatum TaxID=110093 RepID=UPI0022FDC986|nr:uncharacterized protein BJ171DRAFT_515720 [Polychytrium aggregatum]KAI9202113.1 hypothetical protein BJ171DRAFT_515720 [Polychytrium aggregatum]